MLAAIIDKSFAYRRWKAQVLLERSLVIEVGDGYLVARSQGMRRVIAKAEVAARSDLNLLLLGETGVGKGVLAQFIHERSQRRNKKFASVRCAGVPETLFESELFGHARGSFTGAIKDHMGLFEAGEGGTIFLDEIDNAPPAIQVKLLEAVEDKIIRRVGETETRKVDVRLISASNKELKREMEEGRFREDLYFRISPISILIPPLRERKEDIPVLAECFLEKASARAHKRISGFGPGVMDALLSYPWPGNVRELRSVVERAVAMAPGKRIFVEDLSLPEPSPQPSLKEQLMEYERSKILEALSQTQGNITRAAQILKITPRHLRRLMNHYGIEREETVKTKMSYWQTLNLSISSNK